MASSDLAPEVRNALHAGQVIPAHPLALTTARKLDERRQRALTRYYAAAGAGGIAVGVHTTQFAIRDAAHGLLAPVLELTAETMRACEDEHGRRLVRIAGICGDTRQSVGEARLARDFGYDLGLLSLAALPEASDQALIDHARAVGEVIPLFGFYLQPAVGGRDLSYEFWRRFAELESVAAIKIAPFDRYRTLDVIRAVDDADRGRDIALYTGNDDNIVFDLLHPRIAGGLLGHWAVWTRSAVKLHGEIRAPLGENAARLVGTAAAITDCNAAFFDAKNRFAGCIPGIHEVLRRQGLLDNIVCLDPDETLSPGQSDEIDRVHAAYPKLNDEGFVAQHLDDWLR